MNARFLSPVLSLVLAGVAMAAPPEPPPLPIDCPAPTRIEPARYPLAIIVDDGFASRVLRSEWGRAEGFWAQRRGEIESIYDVRFVEARDWPGRCARFPAIVAGNSAPVPLATCAGSGAAMLALHDAALSAAVAIDAFERERIASRESFPNVKRSDTGYCQLLLEAGMYDAWRAELAWWERARAVPKPEPEPE